MPPRRQNSKKELLGQTEQLRMRSGLSGQANINAFWLSLTGESHVDSSAIHECPFCGTPSATLSPKTNGDWYFGCLKCHENWNLLIHIKKVMRVDFAAAGKWMMDSKVIPSDSMERYVTYSKLARSIKEILDKEGGSFPDEKASGIIVGESSMISENALRLILFAAGFEQPFIQGSTFYPTRIFRDVSGSLAKVIIYSSLNGNIMRSITLIESRHNLFCPNRSGFIQSGTTTITTRYATRSFSLGDFADPRKTLIYQHLNSNGTGNGLNIDDRIEHPKIRVISTENSFCYDMQTLGFLMNNFDVSVSVIFLSGKVLSSRMSDMIASSECFGLIFSFLRNSALMSARVEKELSQRLEKVQGSTAADINDVADKKRRSVNKNFRILFLTEGKKNVHLTFEIDGMYRSKMVVKKSVFKDSNQLYAAIVRTAVRKNFPLPIIYKKPPYQKDLLSS